MTDTPTTEQVRERYIAYCEEYDGYDESSDLDPDAQHGLAFDRWLDRCRTCNGQGTLDEGGLGDVDGPIVCLVCDGSGQRPTFQEMVTRIAAAEQRGREKAIEEVVKLRNHTAQTSGSWHLSPSSKDQVITTLNESALVIRMGWEAFHATLPDDDARIARGQEDQ